MAELNNRNAIPFETKLKILAEVNKKSISRSETAKLYNIRESTLFTIVKNRDSLIKIENSGVKYLRNRSREGKFQKLEEALLKWLKLNAVKEYFN